MIRMTGMNVTGLIGFGSPDTKDGRNSHRYMRCIHPRPAMPEAVMEAAATAMGEAIHG